MGQTAEPHRSGHTIEHPRELTVRVAALVVEAEGVISLRLERVDGAPLPAWEPGAHIDLVLGNELERQYSLCGDPDRMESWKIAVLREPESRGGSEWIHTNLGVGDELTVRGPRNNFPLVAAASYQLIAGGIGITPMLPMIRRLSAGGANWNLLYGGRHQAAMAFRDELSAQGERVTLWPQDRCGLLDLDAVLGAPRPETAVYCCGPEALLEAVEERCASWPQGSLHIERFSPRPGALDGEATSFEVELSLSGLTITVPPEKSIAEAVEAAGVAVPTSCREGTCGTCETRVLGGIPDHRDSFLLAEEQEDNTTMMICCSRAKTPRLVLEL